MKTVHFYIDGFSFRRISDYYKSEHKRKSRLNPIAFESYLRYEISRRFDLKSDCENLAIEKHFYHPNENPRTWKSVETERMLNFERHLKESGYAVHYAANLHADNLKPNENLSADAIFAIQVKKIDLFVLLSTQGQFAELLRQLKCNKIPTMLIGWQGLCKNTKGSEVLWHTDKVLIDFATAYSPLERVLNAQKNTHPLAEIMFEKFRTASFPKYLSTRRCG